MTVLRYTHPHDHELAGLRDYLPRVAHRRGRRWLVPLAIGGLLAVLASVLSGCALRYPPADGRFTPESPAPDASRIAALAIADVPAIQSVAWLRLTTSTIVAGGAVRLSCFIPRTADHRKLRLALVDALGTHQGSTHDVRYDELLVQHVPCGSWRAVCTSLGPSDRVLTTLEQPLTARGSCNDPGPGGDR